MPILVFGLTRPEIEPESTVSAADALSTRPLIDFDQPQMQLESPDLFETP